MGMSGPGRQRARRVRDQHPAQQPARPAAGPGRDQHGPGPQRGHAVAEQRAQQLHAKTNDGQLTPYANWIDFGEHLKHPESLINFVAAYGKHPTILAASTVAAKRAAARAIVDPQPGDVPPVDASTSSNATGAWSTANTGLDDVDLWVGGLAENTNPFGGLLGTTFNYVFENQLTNLQNGDRFYYLARTPGMNLRTQLEGNSFAELIMRNTTAHSLKADAFATADCKFELAHLPAPRPARLRRQPASSTTRPASATRTRC